MIRKASERPPVRHLSSRAPCSCPKKNISVAFTRIWRGVYEKTMMFCLFFVCEFVFEGLRERASEARGILDLRIRIRALPSIHQLTPCISRSRGEANSWIDWLIALLRLSHCFASFAWVMLKLILHYGSPFLSFKASYTQCPSHPPCLHNTFFRGEHLSFSINY